MRNLANRSAIAAREIRDVIKASSLRVDAGTQLIDSTEKTMANIVHAIQNVAATVSEITTVTRSQTADITHISTARMMLDQMTQQNLRWYDHRCPRVCTRRPTNLRHSYGDSFCRASAKNHQAHPTAQVS